MEVAIDMVKKGQVPRENTRNDYYRALLELFHETLENYSDDLDTYKNNFKTMSEEEKNTFLEKVNKNKQFIKGYEEITNGASYKSISNCDKQRKNLKTIHETLVDKAAGAMKQRYYTLYEKIADIVKTKKYGNWVKNAREGKSASLNNIAKESGPARNLANRLQILRKLKMYNQPGGGYTRRNGARKRRATRKKNN